MKRVVAGLLLASALLPLMLLSGCMSYMSDPAGSHVSFKGTLDGAHEVPANASTAGGYLTARYSIATRIFKWRLVVNGLSSPIVRAAFHGPDLMGDDAAIVPINPPFDGTVHAGSATLTRHQAADLLAGRWYVDIRTGKFPAGEIRGQVRRTSR
jgi:hypothetical protein